MCKRITKVSSRELRHSQRQNQTDAPLLTQKHHMDLKFHTNDYTETFALLVTRSRLLA